MVVYHLCKSVTKLFMINSNLWMCKKIFETINKIQWGNSESKCKFKKKSKFKVLILDIIFGCERRGKIKTCNFNVGRSLISLSNSFLLYISNVQKASFFCVTSPLIQFVHTFSIFFFCNYNFFPTHSRVYKSWHSIKGV